MEPLKPDNNAREALQLARRTVHGALAVCTAVAVTLCAAAAAVAYAVIVRVLS